MAAAFFMARISLAAAIAAGEAGFNVAEPPGAGAAGAACLGACAMAGAPASASASVRPAADKIPEKPFIPILLDCA